MWARNVKHVFIVSTHGILLVTFLSSVNDQYCYYNLILNTRRKKKIHVALLPESALKKKEFPFAKKLTKISYQNLP